MNELPILRVASGFKAVRVVIYSGGYYAKIWIILCLVFDCEYGRGCIKFALLAPYRSRLLLLCSIGILEFCRLVMAGGWAKDGSVQEQIDASVEDAVKRIRDQIPQGKSLMVCEECGGLIPEARRKAVPGVRFCIACQSELDAAQKKFSTHNRRGSKDSQLR